MQTPSSLPTPMLYSIFLFCLITCVRCPAHPSPLYNRKKRHAVLDVAASWCGNMIHSDPAYQKTACRGTHQSWPVIRGESRRSLGSVDRLSRWLNMEHGPAPDSDTVGITKHQTIKRNASDASGDLSVSQVAACPRPIQIFREPLTLRAKGSMGAMESVGIHWNPRWNHATCDMECMGIACTRQDLRLYCDASDPWHAIAARRGSTKPPVNSACAKVA